jgi:plasmid stability protein
MANLSVRKLDDETLAQLRARAAQHGVSVEEEARQIIQEAVSAPERLGDLAVRIFGPQYGVELELPQRGEHEPMDFSA